MIVHYRESIVNFTRLMMPDDFTVDNTMGRGRQLRASRIMGHLFDNYTNRELRAFCL